MWKGYLSGGIVLGAIVFVYVPFTFYVYLPIFTKICYFITFHDWILIIIGKNLCIWLENYEWQTVY